MISVLLPSRNRPDQLQRLVDSIHTTASKYVEVVVYVDDDEPQIEQYDSIPDIHLVQGPRITLSDMWNECWKQATSEIFMQCGDDIIFRTQGWDDKVRAEFKSVPDRILFVHGDDGGGKGTWFGTHGFVHREWTDTIGYFTPPLFSSDYSDAWLNEIANMLGRRRYVDIYTEHMHPGFGKGEWDQTHQERLARHAADDVDTIWRNTAPDRFKDAVKLSAVMQ